MTTIGEILTKWGFEIDHEKLTKTEKQLEGIKKRLDFLSAVEVVKGLSELAERFSKFGEQLHLAATSAGLTVEAFQKLSFAAEQSGVSSEEMEHAMARLSRNLFQARQGSEEAQKAFALAGFSGSQVASFKTGQDALLALADKFKQIQDPIQKAALAQQLMGRGSVHMVGFLSQGSKALRDQSNEAQRLGLVLSGTQVEALVKLEHALQKFWALLKAIGATIAAEVAPVFEYLINDFIKFFGVNREIVQVNFENWLIDVAGAMGFVYGLIKGLTMRFIEFAKALHLEGQILPLVMRLVSVALGIFAVHKAVTSAYQAFTAFSAILTRTNIYIAAIVFVMHELIALFTGGWRTTWTGQLLLWLDSFELIHEAIQKIADAWETVKGGVGTAIASVKGFLGVGGAGAATPDQRLAAAGNPAQTLSSISNNVSNRGGNQHYEINAPVTVSVPPGTTADVSKSVKEGIKEHMDRVYRETQRSTTGVVAY